MDDHRHRKPDAWQKLDPVSAYAAQSLDVPGGSFTADTSVTAGKKLKTALAQFEAATKSWARQNGLVVTAGSAASAACWSAARAAPLFIAVKNPFDMSVLALVPGLFAVFALETLLTGASTKRTPAGRDLWSRIGGFRRILATDFAEARFDFSGRKELYTAYIPWAVAFGVAEQWAAKYRIETGEVPPTRRTSARAHRVRRRLVRLVDGRRLLLDGELGDLGVPGHPELVLERRRRRLLRRGRRRRRRGWLLVSASDTIGPLGRARRDHRRSP